MRYLLFAIPACHLGLADTVHNRLLAGDRRFCLRHGLSTQTAAPPAAFVAFTPLRNADGKRQFPL
jgi:hypothetical protein